MSGGHFEYSQYLIMDNADEIDRLLATNTKEDSFGYCNDFSEETIAKFQLTRDTLELASKMLQRVDWLVCSDDSEESFHTRWAEEGLNELV